MLNLDTIIGRGTWRYVGQRVQGLQIQAILIAGKSIELIAKELGSAAYQIGRIHTENAFSPHQTTQYGLTLRQAGQWGFAMGVEDDDRDIPGLKPIANLGATA